MLKLIKNSLYLTAAFLISLNSYGQNNNNSNANDKLSEIGLNPITTSVPFLTIAPDARSGALGDAGVAISPDANAVHWNAAKLAFIDRDMGFSLSYNPWLRKLVNDMSISYLTGYKKINKQSALSVHLLYFDLGTITFTDDNGMTIRTHDPKEYSMGMNYSMKLSENMGVSAGMKFIHSNLSGNFSYNNVGQTRPGNTAAGDVGFYYNKDLFVQGKNTNLAFGANISNIGAKIAYTTNERNFIPTNLRIGTAYTVEIDPFNTFTFIVDANKLMVPTTQIDSANNNRRYVPDIGTLEGMMTSFYDAPGGFREEMREIIWNFGAEYWYHNARGNPLFAVRAGYFHESAMKGNRKYVTLGFGVRSSTFGLDFAYLVPMLQNNPLAESLRFTLHFNFDAKQPPASVTE